LCPMPLLCCETAGFDWVLQNESVLNKSLSMNVFQMRGIGFYTWQFGTRHRQRKWCYDLHRGVLSRRNFKMGDVYLIYYVRQSYIYVRVYLFHNFSI
jgi:hypothetical protein